MDTEINTKKRFRVMLPLGLMVCIVALLYAAWYVYEKIQTERSVNLTQNAYIENEGLSDDLSDYEPMGVLYASAVVDQGTTTTATIVAFDLAELSSPVQVITDPFMYLTQNVLFEDSLGSPQYLLTTITPDSITSTGIAIPALHVMTGTEASGRSVVRAFRAAQSESLTGVSLSPDKVQVAFSQIRDETTIQNSSEAYDLRSWETVILDYQTGEVLHVIEGGALGQWLSPTRLAFLRVDGVHVFDTTTADEWPLILAQPIKGDSTGVNIQTNMAATVDGSILILTSPYMNRIEVFAVDTADARSTYSLGRITVPGTQFFSPVVAPDNRSYAVHAVAEDGSQSRIEIRPLTGRKVVQTVDIPDTIGAEGFALDDWALVRDPSTGVAQ